MADGSSPTRGVAWIALALLLGALLLPLATLVGLTRFADVSPASAATITLAVGFGFALLLSLALAVVAWHHAAGKITAIGGVMLGALASAVMWQQFSQPASELDGTWQGVQWEGSDGTRSDIGAVAMRMTIAGEKLKMTHPAGPVDGFIFTDETQNPKTFHAGGNNMNWVGIYKLDRDMLTLCFNNGDGAERPKEFKSKPASLLVLKRVKQ
jgi:uncharacterized protein (TIGR03067 family)